jgi:hypothetical protein
MMKAISGGKDVHLVMNNGAGEYCGRIDDTKCFVSYKVYKYCLAMKSRNEITKLNNDIVGLVYPSLVFISAYVPSLNSIIITYILDSINVGTLRNIQSQR